MRHSKIQSTSGDTFCKSTRLSKEMNPMEHLQKLESKSNKTKLIKNNNNVNIIELIEKTFEETRNIDIIKPAY